jgi:S1-C subfamily serine protease
MQIKSFDANPRTQTGGARLAGDAVARSIAATRAILQPDAATRHVGCSVVKGSPAQRISIAPGDVITKLNGTAVEDGCHALNLIAQQKPGESIRIHGVRAGRDFEASANVSQWSLPTVTEQFRRY